VRYDPGEEGNDIKIANVGFQDPTDVVGEAGDCFYKCVAAHLIRAPSKEKNVPSSANKKKKRGPKGKPLWPTRAELDEFVQENLVKVSTPVKIKDIARFEELNKDLSLAINVVEQVENGEIFPVRAANNIGAKNQILLLLTKRLAEGSKLPVLHYVLVDEPEKLFAKRYVYEYDQEQGDDQCTSMRPIEDCDEDESEESLKKRRHMSTKKQFICYNCFNVMWTEKSYANHVSWCHLLECQRVILPRKGEKQKFDTSPKNPKLKPMPYFLFYDFECLQVDVKVKCPCDAHERRNNLPPKKRIKKECNHKTMYKKEHKA